ncbi:Uncharacterised protein [Staphylococcus aureus]|nr:Uncharacterised protein [Staphylococcus aureus]
MLFTLPQGYLTVIVDIISSSIVMTNVVFLSIFSFTASKFAFTEGQSIPSSLKGVNALYIN